MPSPEPQPAAVAKTETVAEQPSSQGGGGSMLATIMPSVDITTKIAGWFSSSKLEAKPAEPAKETPPPVAAVTADKKSPEKKPADAVAKLVMDTVAKTTEALPQKKKTEEPKPEKKAKPEPQKKEDPAQQKKKQEN
ncbi:MAG: hypothetical protein V4691_00115, partial [Pseudomonadota bacterium]